MNAAAAYALPTPDWEVEEPDESALVIEDDTPVDNIVTEKQERLLTESLYTSWSGPPVAEGEPPRPFTAMANVGLFSTPTEQPTVPDMMLSLDVTIPEDQTVKKNRSYFMWRYGKPPNVVIELVSNTKGDELGERFRHYLRLRVDFYVVYDPLRKLSEITLQAFELRGGMYVVLDRPWFESVGLGLVEWEGTFEGMHGRWLRWRTRSGELVLTGAERAAKEKARAETAEARAETEKARAEAAEARAQRLAVRLRELGVDPSGDS